MRRLLFLFVAFILAAASSAQDLIRYYPPAGLSTMTGTATATTTTVPILLPDGTAAAPSLAFSTDTTLGWYKCAANNVCLAIVGTEFFRFNAAGQIVVGVGQTTAAIALSDVTLLRDGGAHQLGLRSTTNAQTFRVYNSWTTAGSNYGRFAINATATGTDLVGEGAGATIATGAFRSLQGSVRKALTDAAAAVSFVRIAVPTNGYIGGKVIATANSTDGTNRLTTTSEWYFAGADTGGTVTCGAPSAVGTPATAYRRANTLVCTMTSVTSTTNCDLQITCTDNLAGDQTPIFEWRLDMPSPATVTPQ